MWMKLIWLNCLIDVSSTYSLYLGPTVCDLEDTAFCEEADGISLKNI
jgi:hypothetical protein